MLSDFGVFSTYVVQPGDSLWEIARKYQTTVDQLKGINNLTSNELFPDQILKLPVTKNNIQNTMNYKVQPGDSLWSIAIDMK